MRWAALFGFLASILDASWLIRILLVLVRRRLAAIECPDGQFCQPQVQLGPVRAGRTTTRSGPSACAAARPSHGSG